MAEVMKVFANLHTHTTHSDGVYSPAEIARVAKEEGYGALAITDHDTYTGNREAEEACRALGLGFMPGIEFSAKGTSFKTWYHVTAFHFDPTYPPLAEYLERLSARETHQTETLFHRGVANGFIKGVTWEEVLDYNRGNTWLCNEHVFRLLKHRGLATDLDYPAYFENVFGKHRSEVAPLYDFMQVEDIISLVHAAGGIVVAAHPASQLHTIPALAECGLDGLEVWHSLLSIEQRREALTLARDYDLFASGGSDHEGLCGGEYRRYEHPEETEFWFPPLTLGTTEFFSDELLAGKKSADRRDAIDALLADEGNWERVK